MSYISRLSNAVDFRNKFEEGSSLVRKNAASKLIMVNAHSMPVADEVRPFRSNRYEVSVGTPILIFILFTLVITVGGYFVFQHYKDSIRKDKQDELGAIAELKIRQITTWMAERKADAQVFREDQLFTAAVETWLKQGGQNDETRAKLLARLSSLQHAHSAFGYTSISLLDDQAMLRLSSSTEEAAQQAHEKAQVLDSMRTGQSFMSDIHQGKRGRLDVLETDLVAPLIVAKGQQAHAIGAVLLHIDPHQFLFPLIQRWPTPSPSAETVLVRRDGDTAVFLNELHYRKNAPLAMRLPLNQRQLLATKAVMGKEGVVEGVDYRGVPVVGFLSKVSGTPWFMIAKVDKAEIYAPINRLANWILLLMLCLIGAGGGIVVFWWKKARTQYESHLKHQRLVKHLDFLARYANDIILLLDSTGKIVDFNDRALAAFGYTAEEFLRKNVDGLRTIDFSRPLAERLRQIDQAGGAMIFESMFTRKNGENFPIEVSVRTINIDGEKFYQGIIRDITERKKAEDEILRQKRFFRQVIDSDPNYIFVKDADGRFLLANEAMAKSYGQTTDSIIGKKCSEIVDNPGQVAAYEAANREVLENRQERVAIESGITVNSETQWFQTIRKPLEQDDGKVCVLTIAVNITQQKVAEMKLAESYKKLQRLSLHLEHIRMDERANIALNLHDEMGATLAAIKMGVAWLASKLPADAPQLSAEAANITELTSDGIRIMHQIVTQLRPNLLADVGLTAAINDYVKKFRQHTTIECVLDLPDDEIMLGADQSLTIFRILQEALNNALKHAQADRLEIYLSQRGGSLFMEVRDNGIGFDPSMHKGRSFGLLGIRERALMVGGKARVSSTPGKGVHVCVSIPCLSRESVVSA